MDDELLQDFLIEAGEILERLNEQLVELENSPDDMDMLNTVFRGFHTIKGGAGFLAIEPMVQLCHRSEDIFNLLRNGERSITADLMDVILPVLDVLNEQFEMLRNGEKPEDADPAMLTSLEAFTVPEAATSPVTNNTIDVKAGELITPAESANTEPVSNDDITDDEFDALLNALENPGAELPVKKQSGTSVSASDEISDEEFESLMDDIHGKGKFSADNKSIIIDTSDQKPTKPGVPSTNDKSLITDDEFEALLDDLHGKGKFKTTEQQSTSAKNKTSNEIQNNPAPVSKPVVEKVSKPSPVESKAATDKSTTAKDKPVAETSVRVDTSRLDEIMNMVGELVLARNRVARLGQKSGDEELLKAVANLDIVTSDLQLSVMKTRMQPIKKVFGRFPRVVRDLARSLKKEIKLEMIGEDTDLDKNLVEALADPLVHLVRNSVDHGIEMPDEREAAGKPRVGTVTLSASQEGDHILLSIEDDGKGMDPDILRGIAVKKGLMDKEAAARLDDRECYALIFAPGFSTKEEISDISGRGVGMDVVKTSISHLNGTVEIDSKLGSGTLLSIKVPLTLAIMSTLMVRLHDQLFALPLVNVSEIFHLDLTKTNIMDGKAVILIREKTLPLFYLNNWLVKGQQAAKLPNEGHVVIVHIGTQLVGFVVDELVGQEEVVIKPLGSQLQGLTGLAGATITGDGGIALILDVPGLLRRYA
jgi:two-component system chemotaxis sensor kinase CheA